MAPEPANLCCNFYEDINFVCLHNIKKSFNATYNSKSSVQLRKNQISRASLVVSAIHTNRHLNFKALRWGEGLLLE